MTGGGGSWPRRVVGLDLGTRCGWALATSSEVAGAESGVWDLRDGDHELPGARLARFRDHLVEVAPEVIFYEHVSRHQSSRAAHLYGAFEGVVHLHCREHGARCLGIPVPTVKKRATGRHMAKKEAMVAAARLAFGRPVAEHDEADALWVLQCGFDVLRFGGGSLEGRQLRLHGKASGGKVTRQPDRRRREWREAAEDA